MTTLMGGDAKRGRPLRAKLMFAASAGIMAVAMPGAGVYGTRAFAQALPSECSDDTTVDAGNTANGTIDDGETIECDSDPQGSAFNGLSTTAEDLTLVFGKGGAPGATDTNTIVNDNNGALVNIVRMDGAGDKEFQTGLNTSLEQTRASNFAVYLRSTDGSVTIDNQGAINAGSSPGAQNRAIRAFVRGGAGNLTINSAGTINGWVQAQKNGQGTVDIDISDLESSAPEGGIEVKTGALYGNILTLNVTDLTATAGNGILILHSSELDYSNVNIRGVVSGFFSGARISGGSGAKVILGSDASLIGETSDGLFINPDGAIADIEVTGSGGSKIEGGTHALNLTTIGGDIVVSDLASVSGQVGIRAISQNGTIRISNIDTITSNNNQAIFANTRSGSGNISIQNVSVEPISFDANGDPVKSEQGIYAFSGTGSINIGADQYMPNSEIGNIYTNKTGIRAESDGGAISIALKGKIDAGPVSRAINAIINGGVEDLTINSTGSIYGTVKATQNGQGNVVIAISDLETGAAANGIEVSSTSSYANKVTLDVTDLTAKAGNGILVTQNNELDYSIVTIRGAVSGSSSGARITGGYTNVVHFDNATSLIGETSDGLFVKPTNTDADIIVVGLAPVSPKIEGGTNGINLETTGGGIFVSDLASVSAGSCICRTASLPISDMIQPIARTRSTIKAPPGSLSRSKRCSLTGVRSTRSKITLEKVSMRLIYRVI